MEGGELSGVHASLLVGRMELSGVHANPLVGRRELSGVHANPLVGRKAMGLYLCRHLKRKQMNVTQ